MLWMVAPLPNSADQRQGSIDRAGLVRFIRLLGRSLRFLIVRLIAGLGVMMRFRMRQIL